MKDLNRAARTLNTILNILFWLLIAQGIFAVGHHALMLYRIITDPASISGMMDRLTIDWLTIEAAEGFGVSLDAAASMKLMQLLSAAAITATACLGIRALKRVLLPIELGQPFRTGISKDIQALGKCAFRPAWFIVTAVLSILSLVFRRGEQLQQLADETL